MRRASYNSPRLFFVHPAPDAPLELGDDVLDNISEHEDTDHEGSEVDDGDDEFDQLDDDFDRSQVVPVTQAGPVIDARHQTSSRTQSLRQADDPLQPSSASSSHSHQEMPSTVQSAQVYNVQAIP
ncbi:hypothetical protein BGZ65_005085 [Modicella reniformis]|uniref:Uncharacterized protein n=1 Tax=Modicella reniformis TaxID=1440133 RepID=A0A9P6INY5_9FUNG|nr:hypothetical protein BGZ65_005085 [Modicella reniformis]